MSEFLRIARATLLYPDFLLKAKDLFSRMVNQSGEKHMILLQLKKAITNHSDAFLSFRKPLQQILSDIDV